MKALVSKAVDLTLDAFLSRSRQERLGRHILNRVRGEGNGDPFTNGEYMFLDAVKRTWIAGGVAPVIFDVGANIGEWAEYAARGLSPESVIYLFEPTPRTLEKLRDRSARLPVHSRIFGHALGDTDGVATLYVDPSSESAGTNSLHQRRAEVHFNLHQVAAGSVQVTTGDAMAAEAGVSRIHLLKIDTEGHECAVLRGFQRHLQRGAIDFVQFEYGSAWADSRTLLLDAHELLASYGYRVAKLHPSGVEFFPRYDQRQETYAFANFIACRPELAGAVPLLPE